MRWRWTSGQETPLQNTSMKKWAWKQRNGRWNISCDRQVIVNDCILPLSHRHSSRSLTYHSVADFVVLSQGVRGRYKRPLTSRDFIGLWKEKRYRRNMMFLFAGHSDKPLKSLISMAHKGNHICLYRFSFIYTVNDLWEDAYTCPVNVMNCTTESAIYVMELTVMGWVPIKEVSTKFSHSQCLAIRQW